MRPADRPASHVAVGRDARTAVEITAKYDSYSCILPGLLSELAQWDLEKPQTDHYLKEPDVVCHWVEVQMGVGNAEKVVGLVQTPQKSGEHDGALGEERL